jgi:hypothetical protein
VTPLLATFHGRLTIREIRLTRIAGAHETKNLAGKVPPAGSEASSGRRSDPAGGGYAAGMCRNIRQLYNFDPPASGEEVRASALQYVRKVSGFSKPSAANSEAFDRAVDAVADVTTTLLGELTTSAPPKDRQAEAAKARARFEKRQAA